MKKRFIIAIIVCGIIAQFAVLAAMIVQREITLKKGALVFFVTAPFDPFDAFRGRYMYVDIPALSHFVAPVKFTAGQVAYAVIQCDSNAVGTITSLAAVEPQDGLYIRMRVQWCQPELLTVTNAVKRKGQPEETLRETGKYDVDLRSVADRFYVPEKIAPEVDALAVANRRRTEQQPLACMRIYKGDAVLEDIQIEHKPLLEFVREALKQREEK